MTEADKQDEAVIGTCELCGKPLQLGQFVNYYDDIDIAHANCEAPFGKPPEETPAPADDGSTMRTYVLLGEPALLEQVVSQPNDRVRELEAENERLREALSGIFAELDADERGAPGHGHTIKGVWDNDASNGDRAGQPCKWCAHWEAARALNNRRDTDNG